MKTIKLEDNQVYYNLNELAGFPIGTSLIVTNNTNRIARIFDNSPTSPTIKAELDGFPVWPHQTVLVHGNNTNPAWIRGGINGYLVVQELTSTVSPFTAIELPQDIVTSGVEGFRRLQVDQGDTAFFEGREFREIQKIRLATGARQVYKFTCTEDFILDEIRFSVSTGNYEVHIWLDSNVTETTPVDTPVPFFAKNLSSEFRDYDGGRYISATTIFTGGAITVTDTELYRDYVEMITSGATSQRVLSESGTGSPRYLPASTFYAEIFAINGPVRGTIAIEWEERPPSVK